MPEQETVRKAAKAKREGKSPSTQAGEFVREEIHHIREGKHGARSTKQAIAIGLSKARRAGVDLKPPKKGRVSRETSQASAGVTMATALASLYSKIPVRVNTAMTGEITLTGLVLPVGGIKEKVLAAHRARIQRVILPKENEKDLREIPDTVSKEIQFIFAERIEDVLVAAIPELNELLAVARAS